MYSSALCDIARSVQPRSESASAIGSITACKKMSRRRRRRLPWIPCINIETHFGCHVLSLYTSNSTANNEIRTREKWFNPAQVYDIIGEIYSVLLCTTYIVSILLYIKVSLAFEGIRRQLYVLFLVLSTYSCKQFVVWKNPFKRTIVFRSPLPACQRWFSSNKVHGIGQGHISPSTNDWGSSGNALVDFFCVRDTM